jgi:hypothetical protein
MARSGPEDRLHARPYSRNTSPELTAGPDWNIWVDLSAPLQSLHYKDESEMRRLHTIVGSDGPDGRIIRDTAKSRYVCAKQSYVYNVSFTLRCSCSDRNTCVITDLADVYRFSIHTPKKSVHAFRLRVPEVRHQTVRIPCGSRIHYSFRTPFRLVAGHGLWIRFAASNLQIFRHAWKKPMGKSASVSKNEPLTTCAWRIFERMVFPRPRTRLLIGIFKYHCSATVSIHRTPRHRSGWTVCLSVLCCDSQSLYAYTPARRLSGFAEQRHMLHVCEHTHVKLDLGILRSQAPPKSSSRWAYDKCVLASWSPAVWRRCVSFPA